MFSFRNIVLVLLLQVVHGQYEHSVTFGDGKFQLQWSVVDRQLLKVRLTGETDGWVGFGIANEAQMVGSDVVIAGLASDGSAVFDDRFAEKRMLPKKGHHFVEITMFIYSFNHLGGFFLCITFVRY